MIMANSKSQNTRIIWKTLYSFVAFFLPNIFLLYLYNNNKDMNYLKFIHCIMLAAILSIISIGLFLLFNKLTRSNEGSLLALLIFWVLFWLFEIIFDIVVKYSTIFTRLMLVVSLMSGIIIAIWYLRGIAMKLKQKCVFINMLATIVFILEIINIAPAVYSNLIIPQEQSIIAYELKSEFLVDDSLPQPDVYWIHMDGMMGFNMVEKYFMDTQDDFKIELIDRGFILNENAELRAGYTTLSIPVLMCPTFYDSYLDTRIAEVEHLVRRPRQKAMNEFLKSDGIDLQVDIAINLELFRAFMAAGYTEITISTVGYSRTPIDMFYRLNNERYPFLIKQDGWSINKFDEFNDLIQLLCKTTPLSLFNEQIEKYRTEMNAEHWQPIPDYNEIVERLTEQTLGIINEKRVYRRLLDSFRIQSPKFVYVDNDIAHGPFNKIYMTEEDNPCPDNNYAFDILYLPQHKYATKVAVNTIDLILDQKPDAVIVLQGDHGPQIESSIEYLREIGYADSQIIEMNQSVISAIRVPPQYGELSEPLHPIDISRWLVNNFVGQNYEYRYNSAERR